MFFLSGRKMILTCLNVSLHHVSINDFGFLIKMLLTKLFWRVTCDAPSETLN